MKRQNILPFSVILFIGIISINFEKQNSVIIEGDGNCSSIDSTLFRKLAIMVRENQFDRQYYEVIYYNHNKGCSSYVLNYNTTYQVLSISTDPCSGFNGYGKLDKEELFKIADKNIKIIKFYKTYKMDFPKDYGRLPTKSCSFSLFDLF